jgi:hypothetical protein
MQRHGRLQSFIGYELPEHSVAGALVGGRSGSRLYKRWPVLDDARYERGGPGRPNEPTGGAANLAQEQIGIIGAVRDAGFSNPIGVQPDLGYDQSDIPLVPAAVGTAGLYVTPHTY